MAIDKYPPLGEETIPKGMVVMYSYDEPLCVNPAHLSMGTHKENMQDCIRKGRFVHVLHIGSNHSKISLTEKDILKFRREHARNPNTAALARKHGVAEGTMRHIIKKDTWRHV